MQFCISPLHTRSIFMANITVAFLWYILSLPNRMLTVCHNSRNDSKKAVIVWYKALNLARNMVSVVWGLQQLVGRLTYWLQLVSCCSFTLNLSTPLPIIIVVIVLRFRSACPLQWLLGPGLHPCWTFPSLMAASHLILPNLGRVW